MERDSADDHVSRAIPVEQQIHSDSSASLEEPSTSRGENSKGKAPAATVEDTVDDDASGS